MDTEQQLLNLLKHYLVREYMERGVDAMCMEEFLPLCAALLFPYRNTQIVNADSYPITFPIIKSLKPVIRKSQGLEQYSLEALRQYFQKNWLSKLSLEEQKELLKDISLIANIEDDGYFSLKGNDNVYNSYLNKISIPDITNNYGSEQLYETTETMANHIVEPMGSLQIEDVSMASEPIQESNTTSSEQAFEQSEEENTTEVETTSKNKSTKPQNNTSDPNKPFCDLYNKLLADYKNPAAKYVWQWKLKLDDYTKISECIKKSKLPTVANMLPNTAKLLALYLGEFYKREYERDNKKPFPQLNVDLHRSDFYKSLCEKLGLTPYKKTNDAHLFSLYVSGGLPVHYLSSKLDNNKSNILINCLSKLFGDDEIDAIEGETLLEKLNNTSLRESYHQKHAIYQYIQTIRDQQNAWDSSDDKNSDFAEFLVKIKEANKKAEERRKFKLCYSLWMRQEEGNVNEFVIFPKFRFNPEDNGERHFALSNQKLSSWGIQNPPAQFSLDICNQPLSFTWCCNGDYVSANKVDNIDMPPLDLSLTPEMLSAAHYIIYYNAQQEEPKLLSSSKLIKAPFEKGYIQFYSDDDPSMGAWISNKGGRPFIWSGILYDTNRYQLLTSELNAIHLNEQIDWVCFKSNVTLKDSKSNKLHTFFNSKGSIYAKPTESCWHSKILNSKYLLPGCCVDGMVPCKIGDNLLKAYLVLPSVKFDIYRVEDDERIDVQPVIMHQRAEDFYNSHNGEWTTYDANEELHEGLYVFRIGYAYYTSDVICYVLPNDADIDFYSQSDPYLVKFKYFTNVSLSGTPSTVRDNEIVFRIAGQKNETNFTFKIGDELGCVYLKTYHPRPQTYMCYHDACINQAILAYADEIHIQHISSDGCESYYLSEKDSVYGILFSALTGTVTSGSQPLTKTYSVEGIDVRVYTQNIPNESLLTPLELLDLENNSILPINGASPITEAQTAMSERQHDGLLFQSLKGNDYFEVYFPPKFISKNGPDNVGSRIKAELRQNRLDKYANENKYSTDYAYQQFEIACEHRMYFATFDSLLSMCWNPKKQSFLDVTKSVFAKNLFAFIQGYVQYICRQSVVPSIMGLKRLAKEFKFSWKIIKKQIESCANNQLLHDLYNELI